MARTQTLKATKTSKKPAARKAKSTNRPAEPAPSLKNNLEFQQGANKLLQSCLELQQTILLGFQKAGVEMHRMIAEQRLRLNEATDLLEKIRYKTWPKRGLGIGLTPEEMDEVLNAAGRTRNRATHLLNKYKDLREETAEGEQ
jgi:hypothetical protein